MSMVIHTMPVMLRNDRDLSMLNLCLESLSKSEDNPFIVMFNQGDYTNDKLREIVNKHLVNFYIMGDGENTGIPYARQACFEYIWKHYPHCSFITEIHPDMIFSPQWTLPLQAFLHNNPDEPCVSPGILTANGEWHPHQKGIQSVKIPDSLDMLISLLNEHIRPEIKEGFVHPVMHRSIDLKKVGGYIIEDLPGKQGYEDDYLLLSYYHILRLPKNWKPKADLRSCVFHYTMAQRMRLPGIVEESNKNLQGLIRRFGTMGLQELRGIQEIPVQNEVTSKKLVHFRDDEYGDLSDVSSIQGYSSIVVSRREETSQGNGFTYLPISMTKQLDPQCCIAIVNHPFWFKEVNQWSPKAIISYIPDSLLTNNSDHIDFYTNALCLKSDVIITDSEESFIKLSLNYPVVFCYSSSAYCDIHQSSIESPPSADQNTLLLEIIKCLEKDGIVSSQELSQLSYRKRKARIDELKMSLESEPHHEENLFLLAKYLYLSGDFSEAEHYFYQAFSRNVVFNRFDGLKKYYPWCSLVQARQGKTNSALNSHGILATTPELKAHYYQLIAIYDEQAYSFINAEICRVHGDSQYALKQYENVQFNLAKLIKYKLYRERMEFDRALDLLSEHKDELNIRKEKWLVLGEKEELMGDKSRAINYYLQAASHDEAVISKVLRIEAIDQFIRLL